MFSIIFIALFVLFAYEGGALEAESICCEEIKSSLENKTVAYRTLCSKTESRLSRNCCKKIENEIEEHRYAYKTLCPDTAVVPTATTTTITATTKVTTTTTTTATLTTKTPSKTTPSKASVIHCDIPLGVENGTIPDVAMMSSTILNTSSLPHFGRLRSRLGDCAWMPENTADRNSSWIQIDLGALTNVTAVATQGSCSQDQWTKSYMIMYSKNGVNWTRYEELGTTKVFKGNNDSTSIVTNHFKFSFAARFVRISPRSWHKNAALRIELFTDCHSPVSSPNLQSPRSCLDHSNNGLKTNGYYNIYDASSNLVTVYCDMTSERGKAWTLVTSFATSNKDMPEFQSKAFYQDFPVNEGLPNWNRYRMNLNTMSDLSTQSTHWRATCNFPTHGVDYTDYVRAKFTSVDALNFQSHNKCGRVEFINIRGHQCSDCDLPWWQKIDRYPLHTDSSYTTCTVDFSQGSVSKEDNFGHYAHVNPNFRCTSDPSATTNWWFGGNVS